MDRVALKSMILASAGNRAAFKAALEAHFKTPDGLADLANAPRIQQGDGVRSMTAHDAVEALLDEFPR